LSNHLDDITIVMSRPPSPPRFPYTTLFRSRATLHTHPERGHVCDRDGVVLAGHDRLGQVEADLLRVHVEGGHELDVPHVVRTELDRKSTRLNSSHDSMSYAVFCLKKKIFTN